MLLFLGRFMFYGVGMEVGSNDFFLYVQPAFFHVSLGPRLHYHGP